MGAFAEVPYAPAVAAAVAPWQRGKHGASSAPWMAGYQCSNGECFAVLKILVLLHVCVLRLISIRNNFLAKDTPSVPETGFPQGLTFWGRYP